MVMRVAGMSTRLCLAKSRHLEPTFMIEADCERMELGIGGRV